MKRNENRIPQLDEAALARCDAGIRRLLRMSDREIATAKKRDVERIAAQLKRIQEAAARAADETQEAQAAELWAGARMHGIAPHPHFGPVVIDPRLPLRVRVRAIVDFAGNADDLAGMGITVHSHVQNIFTITATAAELADLAGQAATRRIRLPRMFYPTLHDSVPTAEIDQLHAVGAEGNGTLVGVVDGALDVKHHAFRHPGAGHGTRVRFLWVQAPEGPFEILIPGQTPEEYSADPAHPGAPDFHGLNYGRIYDQAAIDAALELANPYGMDQGLIAKTPRRKEHGTLVAGIAAGSGHVDDWAAAPVEVGAAPLADIVHVCSSLGEVGWLNGVTETDIIHALDFIFRIADYIGQPVVISNSYGTSLGPHTGRTEFDTARDAFLDSYVGRSLVFAAGNDGNAHGFREGTIAAGAVETFNMETGSILFRDLILDVWYSGPELAFKMDWEDNTTNWQVPPNVFVGTFTKVLINDAEVEYHVEVYREPEAASGLRNLRFYVQDPWIRDNWTVNLRNDGGSEVRFRAWIGLQGCWHSMDRSSPGAMTLLDTGYCRSVLTVGACDKPDGDDPEEIADYSGRGPTLDGRIKPEIVAVGTNVTSAKSRTGDYVEGTGTSMATPLVAGAVALLLENDPTLNQDAIKALLVQTADRTNLNLDDPQDRNAYGYGRLRMLAPFQHSQPLVHVDVWVRKAHDDYGFQPYPGDCFCHAPDVTIRDSAGNETTELHWDEEHTVAVRVHNLGDTPAFQTWVRLKYTRPWTAPDEWVECKDPAGEPIKQQEINIPDLGYYDLVFDQHWVPHEGEVPEGGRDWHDHFCLLVQVFNDADPWQYEEDERAASGEGPWGRNIKRFNNVALYNVTIR